MVNGSSSDVCGNKWEDVDFPPEAWSSGELGWEALGTSSQKVEMDRVTPHNIWMSMKAQKTCCITNVMSLGSVFQISNIFGSCMISLTCVGGSSTHNKQITYVIP